MGQDLIIPPQRCGDLATLASTTSMTRIFARANPFSDERQDLQVECGGTILDMLEAVVGDPSQLRYYHCWLTDEAMTTDPVFVDRNVWHLVRPKPGIIVTFRAAPHDGGGSKGVLGIVLRVVVVIAAAVATWYIGGIGGALVGAAIGVAGNLAVNALIPPPRPPQPPKLNSSAADSPSYSITGTTNQPNPYAPIPRIFGHFRYTPPYGALPYTEIIGANQYIRLLFCFGYGPVQIEDIKIGETPIENYQDVQFVIRYGHDTDGPLTLYSNDIHEEQFSVEVTNTAPIFSIIIGGVGFLDVFGDIAAGDRVAIIGGGTWIRTVAETKEHFLNTFPGALNGAVNPKFHAVRLGDTIKVTGVAGNNPRIGVTSNAMAWRTPRLVGGLTAYQTNPLGLDDQWIGRTSQDDADELTGDITFPQGLVLFTPLGDKDFVNCRFDIRYRLSGSTNPWLYHSTPANATFFPGGNAVNGAQMAIGVVTYTFQSALTNVAGNVAIGATPAITLANLIAAINQTAGAGTAYAAATVRNPTIVGQVINGNLVVTARHVGNATGIDGNAYGVYSNGFPGAWDDFQLHGGVDAINITAKDSIVRTSFRIVLPVRGKYDIQIRRLTKNATDNQTFDRSYWSVLRTVRYAQAFTLPGVATLEMRIRATDQLNGVVDTLNAVCTSILPVYDAHTGIWTSKETRNPAWCDLEVLRGRANKAAVALDQIYLPDYSDWAAACDALDVNGNPMFTCDGVIDYAGTVRDVRTNICAAGRATPGLRDGKLTIIRDIPQDVPVQHITPRNSRSTSWTKPFVEMPHGLKVRFPNEEKGWQIDEQIVYADGFNKLNATIFQTMNVALITRWTQIYRDTRYHIAVAKLRPVTYQRSMDPEYLMCRRGDLVHSSDDVLLHGLGSGRIKSVITDEDGRGIEIVTDERFAMASGVSYALEIRRATNAMQLVSLQTVEGESNVLTPLLPIAAGNLPEPGDLVAFGEAGRVTVPMVVKAITPDNDLGATLTLLDAAPAVHTADKGVLPPFDSQITQPVQVTLRRPGPPTVVAIQSDESVLVRQGDGSLTSVIVITLGALSSGLVPARTVQAQIRRSSGVDDWHPAVSADANVTTLTITSVDDGELYDLRFRNVAVSTGSDWVQLPPYRVIGKTTPPPSPTNMRDENGTARWDYANAPRDMAGFRLKDMAGGSLNWDAGAVLNGGRLVTSPAFDLSTISSGVHAIMVKAVDTAGNESDDFTYIIVNLGDVLVNNVVITNDLAAAGFPGVITNGTVIDGVLQADVEADQIWSSDPMATIWSTDRTAPIWTSFAKQMTYQVTVTTPRDAVPCQLKLLYEVDGDGWSIEYDPGNQSRIWSADPAAPAWSSDPTAPIWTGQGGFVSWPGEISPKVQSYTFRFRTSAAGQRGRISACKVVFDVPDENETIEDLIVPITGIRLPITKDYRWIKNVSVTVQDDGGTAVGYLQIDKDPINGPLIACIDKDRNRTAGLIDAWIQGAQGKPA